MKNLINSEQILMELEREAYRRTMARDLSWMKDLHAREALMFSPGSETKLAIEVFDAALTQQGQKQPEAETSDSQDMKHFFWEPVSAKVSASDDMGWVHGLITITDSAGNKEYGKYVSVWVKEDGQWKVAAEIRNANQ